MNQEYHELIHKADIVVAATCFEDAKPAIDLAVWAAASQNAKLKATMIVEMEVSLERLTPSQTAISPAGLRQQDFDMANAMKRDLRLFRDALSKAAGTLKGGWAFEEFTGDVEAFLEGNLDPENMLIIGFHPLHSYAGAVVVVTRDGSNGEGLLEFARDVAGSVGLPIEQINLGATDVSVVKQDNEAKQVARKASPDIFSRLGGASAKVVIADRETVRMLGLRRLLLASRCPVIVW